MSDQTYVWIVMHGPDVQAVFKKEDVARAHVRAANARGQGYFFVDKWPVRSDMP